MREVSAKEITARLYKEAISASEKANETLENSKQLVSHLDEALKAIDENDTKKALEILTLTERHNKNSINGSSLITGIIHAIKALQ